MSKTHMQAYVPLAQSFAAKAVSFHAAVAAKLGLHVTDLRGLRLLGGGPMTAGALGEQAGLTAAAATALIDRLERAGYVARERDAGDRRRVTVHAAQDKLQEVERMYQRYGARMAKLLSGYDATEFAAITSFLQRSTEILAEEARKLQEGEET